MPHRLRLLACAAAVTALAVPGAAHASSPAAAPRDGVVFDAAHHLKLDLYAPGGTAPRGGWPVVVLIHGGGFTRQSRKDPGITRTARALAREGIVAAAIDYRLLGSRPVPSARVAPLVARLPDAPISAAIAAAVDDTLTAVGFLDAHAASYHINMRRLGMVGSSAGAITADHVGYALDDLGIAGPRLRFVGSLWGGVLVPPGATLLEHGAPPLFAVHGDADTTVNVSMDDTLVAQAKRAGVSNVYYRIPGGTHGYAGSRFFAYRLKGGGTPFTKLLAFAKAKLG